MAVEGIFRCVICGTERLEANHWRLAWLTADGALVFSRWDDDTARRPEVDCICGQAHAHKVLDRYLSTREER